MPYERGDVVLVLFPHSDVRTAERRPALVVQADGMRAEISQKIVAMITSNLARLGHPRGRRDPGGITRQRPSSYGRGRP
ncbi:hypothetical protein CMK11_01055 [Candidatus Poribacteria bacterium]|nr:hypothetical protein [Candidatus Poribacteria bacterium]